jgi:hypothetical protein
MSHARGLTRGEKLAGAAACPPEPAFFGALTEHGGRRPPCPPDVPLLFSEHAILTAYTLNKKEEAMEQKKVMVCTCENCGNEAEMTIKCEEIVVESKSSEPTATPPPKKAKGTFTCTQCGNEAEMIIDL